jgi:polyphenol oxidase
MSKSRSDDASASNHSLGSTRRRVFLARAGLTVGAMVVPSTSSQLKAQKPVADSVTTHAHLEPKPFVFKYEPPRKRKSLYDYTDPEIRLLCRAVSHMRNGTKDATQNPPIDAPLSVESPLQWDQWVMTHAKHCTEDGPNVPQVHWSWFFLPWHRAYLFFLERHLANIVTTVLKEDGSKFALPYWDWIAHKEIPNTRERQQQGRPSPLFGYDLTRESMNENDGLGFDNLALWDGYRAPTTQAPKMDPTNEKSPKSKEEIESTLIYMSRPYIDLMLELPWDLFMGKPTISRDDGQGVLEHYPHNNGHDWVGSRQGKNRDMGTLRYAALDPIFFMHHSNIDRIWNWYKKLQPDPDSNSAFGQQRYIFTDIDGSPVTLTVRDIIRSITNVSYQEPQSGLSPQLRITSEARKERMEILVNNPNTLTAKPLTLAVETRPELKSLLGSGTNAGTPAIAVLEVQIGALPFTEKFTINAFVNKPDANRETSIKDPHYIGRIRGLDSEGRRTEEGPDITHTFPIVIARESNFYRLVRPAGSFTITLVPANLSPSDQSFRTSVKSIRLRVFE